MFVNVNSWKVYEYYRINGQKIERLLGIFNQSYSYIPIVTETFLNRRSDFYGYNLKAMTENSGSFLSINLTTNDVQFDSISQTYDVTYVTCGNIYEMFMVIKSDLNFTATLHKRKDGNWGPTLVLPNGTVEAHGIVKSVTSGFAEMIVTR